MRKGSSIIITLLSVLVIVLLYQLVSGKGQQVTAKPAWVSARIR